MAIEAVLASQQFIVRAALHYLPITQHNDAVGVDDRGQTVGNDKSGPSPGSLASRVHQPI